MKVAEPELPIPTETSPAPKPADEIPGWINELEVQSKQELHTFEQEPVLEPPPQISTKTTEPSDIPEMEIPAWLQELGSKPPSAGYTSAEQSVEKIYGKDFLTPEETSEPFNSEKINEIASDLGEEIKPPQKP